MTYFMVNILVLLGVQGVKPSSLGLRDIDINAAKLSAIPPYFNFSNNKYMKSKSISENCQHWTTC